MMQIIKYIALISNARMIPCFNDCYRILEGCNVSLRNVAVLLRLHIGTPISELGRKRFVIPAEELVRKRLSFLRRRESSPFISSVRMDDRCLYCNALFVSSLMGFIRAGFPPPRE
jgi:hypothetical protein